MADTRYLKQLRQGWYFVMAVPRQLQGKKPFVTEIGTPKTMILKSLGTRDLTIAQQRRWEHVNEQTHAFARCVSGAPLSLAEIDAQAMECYRSSLEKMEADALDSPSALMGLMEKFDTEAWETDDFTISLGLERKLTVLGDDLAEVARRTECRTRHGNLSAARRGTAAGKDRCDRRSMKALKGLRTPWPATFVSGGIDPITLQPRRVARVPHPKVRASEAGKTVTQVASEYIAELQRDKGAKLSEQTRGQHEMAFRLFGQYVKDAPLSTVDRSLASEFLNAVGKLNPVWGRSPQTKKLTVWELIERFGGDTDDDGLSNRTVNRYVSSMTGLYKWAKNRGYFDGVNPFTEQARPKARRTGWVPYAIGELNKLFGLDCFWNVDATARIYPAKHNFDTALLWVPLIALFSGMRLGEICQLRTADLHQKHDVSFFNVAEEGEGQSIKTEAGIRRVPIHSTLIKIGLLHYLDGLPEGQLFPGLAPGGPDGKLSWYFTRRYTEYRRSVGVNRPRISFHSFRKNVTTTLDNAGVHQADVAALIGHGRGFTFDTYSRGLEFERLAGIVAKIEYPGLDLTHLYAN